MLKNEKKPTKTFRQIERGESAAVITKTSIHNTVSSKSYGIQQTIERFEPKKAKGNLSFSAHYFIDKTNKRGMLSFHPRKYSMLEQEYCLEDWYFELEFINYVGDCFNCEIKMYAYSMGMRESEYIDIGTFSLIMTKFFESCNPHCQYDFMDTFIEVFQSSKYEKLQRFAECSIKNYEYYRKYKDNPLVIK